MAQLTNKIARTRRNQASKTVSFTDMAKSNDNRLQALIDAGKITRDALSKMESVDMSNCVRPLSVLQLNYNPVNLIGPATTAMTNVVTIDVNTDLDSFKKMFVNLKERENHVEWKSIWKLDYNMFNKFDLVTGQHYVIYVVTNEEMHLYAEQVAKLDKNKLTKEEAFQMQLDFRPIVRAFQESYIDCVKDKTKKFTLDYTDIINSISVKSTFMKKYRNNISFNFDAVKAAKRAGKEIPDFQFSLVNDKNENYNDIATDVISKINDTLVKTTVDFLNGDVKRVYATSDDTDLLDRFVNAAAENKELALYIKQVYKLLNNAIFNDNVSLDKEHDYAVLRNCIYSKATELQVEAKDVINVAISVAMSNVFASKDGIVVETTKDRFSDVHVKNIFPEEFVYAIADVEPIAVLEVSDIVEITRDIEDGETIEFVDGVAVDGSIVFDVEFSGYATEEDGCFIYELDIYSYDYVESVMIDITYKENVSVKALKEANANKTTKDLQDKGQALNKAVEENAITHVLIGGANNNIVVNSTTKQVIANTKTPTTLAGNKVIDRIMTFEAKNNNQQLFMLIFE
jgi:hypothetical protein